MSGYLSLAKQKKIQNKGRQMTQNISKTKA